MSRSGGVPGSIRPYRGRWRVRVHGSFLGMFDTYDEAAETLKAYHGIKAAQKQEAGAIVTLRIFGDAWLDEREELGVVRSVDRERSCWRAHILNAPFIDRPLKRISQHDVQKWLRKLATTEARSTITVGRRPSELDGSIGLYRSKYRARVRDELLGLFDTHEQAVQAVQDWKRAHADDAVERHAVHRPTGEFIKPKTIGNIRHVLKQCLVQAVIEGKIHTNPLTNDIRSIARARVVETEEETWTFLTEREIAAVFKTLPDARTRAFFAVAIYGGLRQGEILGLRWRDIALDARHPELSELQVRRNRQGPVKTAKSRRSVPMLVPLQEALLEWQAERDLVAVRGRHSREVIVDLNRLVFPSDHGGCYAQGYDCAWSDRRFRKKPTDTEPTVYPGWRSKSGIDRLAVTFHCLRHTCASMLTMGGRDFPKLDKERTAKWLGHSSTKVTERYIHLDPAQLKEPVGRLYRFRPEHASQRAVNDAEDRL